MKYIGVLSYMLGVWMIARDGWRLLADRKLTSRFLTLYLTAQALLVAVVTAVVYLSVFYLHLSLLTKAGPHDSVMTSAFQASLEVRQLT